MTLSGFKLHGDHLAKQQGFWDVQHSHLGILELDLLGRVPDARTNLSLALANFNVPGRNIGKGTLNFLNGTNQYLTKPDPMDDLEVTFRDFVSQRIRAYLLELFRFSYDERTGLMQPMSVAKMPGRLVLFSSNGQQERVFELEGVVMTKVPDINIDYAGDGEVLLMDTTFSIDRIIPAPSVFSPQSGSVDTGSRESLINAAAAATSNAGFAAAQAGGSITVPFTG